MIKAGSGSDQQSTTIRAHKGYVAFTGRDLPDGMSLQVVESVLRQTPKGQLGPGAEQWSWETFVREMHEPSTEGVRKFRDACMSSLSK